jgi:hypothetical protein
MLANLFTDTTKLMAIKPNNFTRMETVPFLSSTQKLVPLTPEHWEWRRRSLLAVKHAANDIKT